MLWFPKRSCHFVRSFSRRGGVSTGGGGSVQSGPNIFLIKHGQAQPEQRPLRVPPPHLFPKPDRNNFPPLPILPTKQKKESGRKENNRCHFRVALGFFFPSLWCWTPSAIFFFLNHYRNKRHNWCSVGRCTQTRSHMHICSQTLASCVWRVQTMTQDMTLVCLSVSLP